MREDNISRIPEDVYLPMPSSVPMEQRSDRADILEKIKPEHVVEIIRNRLQGKDIINGQWVDIPILKKHSMSEEGAWIMSNMMLGIGNTSTSISKLNDNEIKNRLRNLTRSTMIKLICNVKPYGIKNVSDFYYIHEIMFSHALVVLKQADEASIQEMIKGVVHENRNVSNEVRRESRLKRMLGLSQ